MDRPGTRQPRPLLRSLYEAALAGVDPEAGVERALARPEVKDLFPDLFAERGVQEIRLKELSKKASEKLVR